MQCLKHFKMNLNIQIWPVKQKQNMDLEGQYHEKSASSKTQEKFLRTKRRKTNWFHIFHVIWKNAFFSMFHYLYFVHNLYAVCPINIFQYVLSPKIRTLSFFLFGSMDPRGKFPIRILQNDSEPPICKWNKIVRFFSFRCF